MKTLWQLLRILLGIVFIFSGFVKGIDPLGSAYKFTDYFNAWGVEGLNPVSLPLGILLSATEFITGIALLFNVFISFFSLVSLAFMGFFTALTLWIAIQNPVTDCGCFGDAIKLSNWATFYKNIFFLGFAIIVFYYRKKFKPAKNSLIIGVMAAATIMIFAYLVDYSYNHLPIIDFRPYKVGTNIPEAMIIPEDAPQDVYENIFYYKNKKTGKTKKFNQENYPWQDTLTWEFVSAEDAVLVKKGYEPPIHNFIMETKDGEDVKDFFLYDEGYTVIFISHDLLRAQIPDKNKISNLIDYTNKNNINFIGLTASLPEDADSFLNKYNFNFEFLHCDEITLKTIVRSNPGFILLKNGTILDKWHVNDVPSQEEMDIRRNFFDIIKAK
ncbi:BT_3928 family protein [Sunxiuqinia sp. A32]|uniref:BT_3928 family protein n=1 Tax=Sunxiuqinia sp. A32 TaxID=3461496 RepID=UPI004045C3E4